MSTLVEIIKLVLRYVVGTFILYYGFMAIEKSGSKAQATGVDNEIKTMQTTTNEYDLTTYRLTPYEDELLTLLLHLEDYRLYAYRDVIGIKTVGIGFTQIFLNKHKMGEKIDKITLGDSIYLILTDFYLFEDKYLKGRVYTSREANTLYSLVFNIGTGNYDNSTLKKRIEAGENLTSALKQELPKFKYAGGKVVKGLEKRRQFELDYLENGL